MRTCDYLPEDNRTNCSCAWDWNCCRSISSSCRRRQWIKHCAIFGTSNLCYFCTYHPEFPCVFYVVESRLLQSKVKFKKIYTRQIPDGKKIESPYTENHIHMQIITLFANFTHVYRFSYYEIWHSIWIRLQIPCKMIQHRKWYDRYF